MARTKPTPESKGKPAKSKAIKDNTPKTTPKSGVKKSNRLPRGSKRDWSQYSHNLPDRKDVAKNGRQSGRNLIAWTRPRMAEKLLLHIEYEAALHNRPIPWDAVAHRFNPGSSGEALTQRLMRLRKELVAEGHLVPPAPQKPGGPIEDVAVRGFVRAHPDRVDDAYTTRKVAWTEPIDDLKKPLGNAVYALQGQKNEVDDDEYDFDEDEVDDNLEPRQYSRAKSSESSTMQSSKVRGPTRPARKAAKNVSYAEDEDDALDEASPVESGAHSDEHEGDEREGQEIHVQHSLRASSRAPRDQPAGRPQSRDSGGGRGRGRDLDDLDAGVPTAFSPLPFGSMTPGARGLGAAHMSPYGMSPNGMHWFHGGMGMPMMPFGMGMGMGMGMDMTNMMGGFNTTPTRSSAFTTHATSPADFDIEAASPRSAAFFQAHLNEYNSPTPRGHADFGPTLPIPTSLAPSDGSMASGSAISGDGMSHKSEPTQAEPDDGHSGMFQESPDAEFSSMFEDAGTMAKRVKKAKEGK